MEEEELDLAVVKTENDCGVDDYLSGEEEQEQSDEEDEGPALTNLTRPVFHCQVGQCQESLPNQFSWREHVKSAHNLDPYDFLSPAPRVELVPLLSRPPPNLLPLQSSSPTDNDHAAAYQCVYKRCPVQISSLAALQKHLQTCHHKKSIRKPSLCPFPDCGEEFRPVNLLRLHLQSVHKSVANQILVSIQDKHEEPDDELEDTEDKPRNKGGRPKKDYFILTGNAIKDRGEYKCVYLHCHLPRRSLRSLEELQEHLKSSHNLEQEPELPRRCPFPRCGGQFRSSIYLRHHMKRVHKALPYLVDKHTFPDYRFGEKAHKKKKVKLTKGQAYGCVIPDCQAKCWQKDKLVRHLEKWHGIQNPESLLPPELQRKKFRLKNQKKWTCVVGSCGGRFVCRNSLRAHLRKLHKLELSREVGQRLTKCPFKNCKCALDGEKDKVGLWRHFEQVHKTNGDKLEESWIRSRTQKPRGGENEEWACMVADCGEVFNRRANLRYHLKQGHGLELGVVVGERMNRCPWRNCGLSGRVLEREQLWRHILEEHETHAERLEQDAWIRLKVEGGPLEGNKEVEREKKSDKRKYTGPSEAKEWPCVVTSCPGRFVSRLSVRIHLVRMHKAKLSMTFDQGHKMRACPFGYCPEFEKEKGKTELWEHVQEVHEANPDYLEVVWTRMRTGAPVREERGKEKNLSFLKNVKRVLEKDICRTAVVCFLCGLKFKYKNAQEIGEDKQLKEFITEVCPERKGTLGGLRKVSICGKCRVKVGKVGEKKEGVDNTEDKARRIQMDIQREMRKLGDCLGEYEEQMGRMEDLVRESDVSCLNARLETQKEAERTMVVGLRTGIGKASGELRKFRKEIGIKFGGNCSRVQQPMIKETSLNSAKKLVMKIVKKKPSQFAVKSQRKIDTESPRTPVIVKVEVQPEPMEELLQNEALANLDDMPQDQLSQLVSNSVQCDLCGTILHSPKDLESHQATVHTPGAI